MDYSQVVRQPFLIRSFAGSNPSSPEYFEEMAEWLKAADCKSVEISLRRFESYFLQLVLMTD